MLLNKICVPILCALLVLFFAPASLFAETVPGESTTVQSEVVTDSGNTPVLVPVETPADTEEPSDEAGVTPDSWLYSLEKMIESVQVAVTFNAEGKAELLIEFANERLAEAEIMSEANQQDLMEEVLKAYSDTIKKANLHVMQMIEDDEAASAEDPAALAEGEEAVGTVEETESTSGTEETSGDDAGTGLVIENLLAKIEVVQSDAEKIVLKLTGELTEEQTEIVQNIIQAEVRNTIAIKAYATARIAYTDAVKQFADAKADLAQARVSGDEAAIQAGLDKLTQAEQYKNDMQELRKDVQKVKVDVAKDTKEVIKEQRQIIREQKKDAADSEVVEGDVGTSAPDTESDANTDTETGTGTGTDTEINEAGTTSDGVAAVSPDTIQHGSGNGKGNKNSR